MTKIVNHVEDYGPIVIVGMLLSDEDLVLEPVPRARPIFIRPGNTERIVWFVLFDQSLERQIQQPPAGEPVIEVAEAIQAISLRELGLLLTDFFDAKIIKAQVRRYMRLIMTRIVRPRLCDIRPIGKSLSPPAVIFRNGMILRQIKSD